MSMRELSGQIQCPILVCDAVDDKFFGEKPKQLADALGARVTYRRLTSADAAGEHCQVGASDVVNRVVMDWLEDSLSIDASGVRAHPEGIPIMVP
jgi:hypothetical protein